MENAQVAVYLTYAAPNGHTPIDRELYLPKSWVDDPGRRERAEVPAATALATKPEAGRADDHPRRGRRHPGAVGYRRRGLRRRSRAAHRHPRPGLGYVFARRLQPHRHHRDRHERVDQLARRCRGGPGGGSAPEPAPRDSAGTRGRCSTSPGDTDTGHHHLLVRRNDKTGELAYYRCYSPDPVTLGDYVRVAGRRWKIEETFQTGKGLAGLDEHQVRTWTSWHRWVTLAMLAHAFLVVTTAAQRRTEHRLDPRRR